MKGIKHIFFDLDHTLWDYDRSAQETLIEIFEQFEISKTGTSSREFIDAFYTVNNELWHNYNIGTIDRQYIKEERFKKIFKEVGKDTVQSRDASEYFMAHCSTKPYLMPDAMTSLNYLDERYELHIITNGFLDAQGRKLDHSGIARFFKVVVTSECANSRKPSPEIFQYSLEKASAGKSESVMIGDNPNTDIRGAQEFGLTTIFYDPSGRKRSRADFSIQSHMELLKLL